MRSSLFKRQEKVPLNIVFFLSTAVSLSTWHGVLNFLFNVTPSRAQEYFQASADPLKCPAMPPCDTMYVLWWTNCWTDALYPDQE